jgi:hypothetical protein
VDGPVKPGHDDVAASLGQLIRNSQAAQKKKPSKKQQKKKELLFVNKKKQKNFDNFWPVALQRPWRRGAKVFWFFFSKKNSLFLLIF